MINLFPYIDAGVASFSADEWWGEGGQRVRLVGGDWGSQPLLAGWQRPGGACSFGGGGQRSATLISCNGSVRKVSP